MVLLFDGVICQFHTFFAFSLVWLVGWFFPELFVSGPNLAMEGIPQDSRKAEKVKNAGTFYFQIFGGYLGYQNIVNLIVLYSGKKKFFLVKLKASCCSAATHLPGVSRETTWYFHQCSRYFRFLQQ